MITKQVISFFTFGVLLLIVGAVLKVSENSQAQVVLAIGLLFELLAVLIFLWNKLKK
ncbi:MAG TPA: hypothetical protein VJ970_02595 [Flavobacteriaceae bacterium]|nr:hypothetical protein [Flavobacteriaceae bacterium]